MATSRPAFFRPIFVIALFLGVTASAGALRADEGEIVIQDLDHELGSVARLIVNACLHPDAGGKEFRTLGFNQFSGDRTDVNYGPGLAFKIEQEIRKQAPQIAIDPNAELRIDGRYRQVNKPRNGLAFHYVLTIVMHDNGSDMDVKKFSPQLEGTGDIAKLRGANAVLDENASKSERNASLKLQVDHPDVVIEKHQTSNGNVAAAEARESRVKAAPRATFAVELFSKPKGTSGHGNPIPVTLDKGQPFAEIPVGHVYEIAITNPLAEEASVTISIDGLDVFSYSELRDAKGDPLYKNYILAPKFTTRIVGWHLRDKPPQNYASFLVDTYGPQRNDGTKHKSEQAVGVITLAFSKVLTGDNAKSANETILGPKIDVNVEAVHRAISAPYEFVSIRYSH